MPCTIYCARVRHDVTEDVDVVADLIRQADDDHLVSTGGSVVAPTGFICVTPVQGKRICLRASDISSFRPLDSAQPKTETRIVNAINSASVGPRTEFRGKWAA